MLEHANGNRSEKAQRYPAACFVVMTIESLNAAVDFNNYFRNIYWHFASKFQYMTELQYGVRSMALGHITINL
jgi:hypothetical protein